MSNDALKIIKAAMAEMSINYEFGEYTSAITYPYFVGEYTESPPYSEDGLQEATFMLTGFTNTTWDALEQAKEQIESYFSKISGKTVVAASGNGVAIFYDNALVVQTGVAKLKSMQINLIIKEWKVN